LALRNKTFKTEYSNSFKTTTKQENNNLHRKCVDMHSE